MTEEMKLTEVNSEPWNKGYTKYTHPSVLKISKTLAAKQRSNFYNWQQKNKPKYASLEPNIKLAELYGVLLGDGCIEKHPRTERLIISFNSKEREHIDHMVKIMRSIFKKQPAIRRRKTEKCVDVYLYQKYISTRLNFPTGEKLKHDLYIPDWVKNNNKYLLYCLKGLFESDGDWTIDRANCTSVMKFRNNMQVLLDDVFNALKHFGFHPQRRKLDTRLAKKAEVERFAKLIRFRKY